MLISSFFFWLHHAAHGILVSDKGSNQNSLQSGLLAESWPLTTREVPSGWLFLVARCSLVSMQVWSCQYTSHFPGFPKLYWSLAQHSSPFPKPPSLGTSWPHHWKWAGWFIRHCAYNITSICPATQLPSFKKPRAQSSHILWIQAVNWALAH